MSKFGGGDSAYRDATFWQFFVQTNWRNGAKQLKFDDPGKYWKSSDVDTTILEQLTLSKKFESAGQLASGIKVNCMEAWRTDAGTQPFGSGGDSTLTVSNDATDAPVDSACTGTAGSTSLAATNASFSAPKRVLIHQTRGTNAGVYEFRTISGYTAGTITLTEPLTNTYTSGAQVIQLKEYTTVSIASAKTLTAKAWNGTVGGILAMYANTSITVTGTIDASGKGYLYGPGHLYGEPNQALQGDGYPGAAVESNQANGNGGGGGYTLSNPGGGGGGGGGGHAAAGTNGSASGAGTSGGGGAGGAGIANLSTMFFGGGGGGGSGDDSSGGGSGCNGGSGGGIVILISKDITIAGLVKANGDNGVARGNGSYGCGGGGAGGSILLKGQNVTLGTNLLTVAAGSGGTGSGEAGAGGAGSIGRIHTSYSGSISGSTTPTLDSSQDSTLVDVPASTTSTAYAGGSDGKIYSWDNGTTWTEVYDTRQVTQFDTGTDADFIVGDDGGTEKACAQGFQVAVSGKMKGVRVYLKKATGTPGDITVTIETNSTDKPSGTLVDAAATGTIPAFTTTSYGWKTVEFSTNFAISATTAYWIVLKTAAAANDQNYKWAGKTASGYAGGTNATSTNGGSTWSAGTSDAYFRALGNTGSVNCMLITKVGGTKKMYIGTGDPNGTENGDARLYSFDGSTWALTKTFATPTESVISSMTEYSSNSTVYIGIGPQAKVYSTLDFSTFTLAKDIDVPQNPGYIYAMKEYNRVLYVGGGSPDSIPTQYYNGFLNIYDTTAWNTLYPFDFTVIKSLEFYDAYLFMGTYHGHLYVYDTSSLNPLFNFKDQYDYQEQIYAMKYFDDKLYLGLYPQEGTSDTNAAVWLFDRRGLSQAHTVSGVDGYRCFTVLNGSLLVGTGDNGYVYKLSTTNYATQGWAQSSYFDANLPSVPKLYNSITVRHDPLASGQSIVVYYRFKESDSWTTLGTSNTVDATEASFYFPSGTTSKKISLKYELNTTTVTASPKLTEVVMQYALYPTRKWQWTMKLKAKENLRLLDGTLEPRDANTIRTDIESLLGSEQLYGYVDIDGTYYNVLVHDIDSGSWVINENNSEDEVSVVLLQQ